jgi:ribonuclease-3
MNLSDLEASLGFSFNDKSLLTRALTHRSYLNENADLPYLDNERLEFLGDAILSFVVAEHLYQRFPEMDEGALTSLRAALVKGDTLARLAGQIGLSDHLLLSRGEAAAGGRQRAPLLAGAFEALIGALYLDQGLDAARALVIRLIEVEAETILTARLDKDAKSMLQEASQGWLQVTPLYRTVETRGPDHAKEFRVQAVLGERVYGEGVGKSKQRAEQEAARAALVVLEHERALQALAAEAGTSPQTSPPSPSPTEFT